MTLSLFPLIVMWAPPRSLSTAFVRVMAARGDLEVLHEPMCNLAAGAVHELPSGKSLRSMAELQAHVDALRTVAPVFIKETCEYDHCATLDGTAIVRDAVHAFMLREPAKVINSHSYVTPSLQADNIGFRHLASLLDLARAQGKHAPIFVEAERLQTAPAAEVEAFCARVGIPHVPESLSWAPGHLDLWRRTQHWHEDAAASSTIEMRERHYAVRVDNEPRLAKLFQENLPFYRYLKQASEAQSEYPRHNTP
jgi:adenylylsulfate kinase